MATIKLEGQEIQLPDAIAQNDEQLKLALTPFYPEMANADIRRETNPKTGQLTVSLVKRAGPKGAAWSVTLSNTSQQQLIGKEKLSVVTMVVPTECSGVVVEPLATIPHFNPLVQALIEVADELNPALALAWQLRQREIGGDRAIGLSELLALQPKIEQALVEGEETFRQVETTLRSLRAARAVASQRVPPGF